MDNLPKKSPFLLVRKGITTLTRKLFDQTYSSCLFLKQRFFVLGCVLIGITALLPALFLSVNPVRELSSLTACAVGDFEPLSALIGNNHRLKSVAFSNGVNKIRSLISEKLISDSQTFAPKEIMLLDCKAMTLLPASAESDALQTENKASDSLKSKPVLATIIETNEKEEVSFIIIQGNSLFSTNQHFLLPEEPKIEEKWRAILTAYTSRPEETDDTPFITASGTRVRKGIVANNFLPFGTKIKIPEVYGDKIFVVEDRMHWRKSSNHIDIWFPCLAEAKKFGIKESYVKVLED